MTTKTYLLRVDPALWRDVKTAAAAAGLTMRQVIEDLLRDWVRRVVAQRRPVVAVVPARTGSRRVPRKNFRDLGGRPLWRWAADVGLGLGLPVIVSSDAPDPGGLPDGVTWLQRPAALATDTARTVDVLWHAWDTKLGRGPCTLVVLQPTTPFRDPMAVGRAVELSQRTGWAVVTGVPEADGFLRRDGTAYVVPSEVLAGRSLYGREYLMLAVEPTVNIDTEADWEEAVRSLRAG